MARPYPNLQHRTVHVCPRQLLGASFAVLEGGRKHTRKNEEKKKKLGEKIPLDGLVEKGVEQDQESSAKRLSNDGRAGAGAAAQRSGSGEGRTGSNPCIRSAVPNRTMAALQRSWLCVLPSAAGGRRGHDPAVLPNLDLRQASVSPLFDPFLTPSPTHMACCLGKEMIFFFLFFFCFGLITFERKVVLVLSEHRTILLQQCWIFLRKNEEETCFSFLMPTQSMLVDVLDLFIAGTVDKFSHAQCIRSMDTGTL